MAGNAKMQASGSAIGKQWPFPGLQMFGYDFVMIDPPWEFKLRSDAGAAKAPQGQYRCMPMNEIAELPVGDLVGTGGVLWCWCTWPLITQQGRVIEEWGFKVKTGGAWIKRTPSGKLRMGTGYIWRSVCEPVLIATIGDKHNFTNPNLVNLIETVEAFALDGVAREHSRKPDEAYAIIDCLLPMARKADVFSREKRPGWDCWGDEVEKFSTNDDAPGLIASSA